MFWTFVTTILMAAGSTMAISVQCPTKRYVVILFQPVTLNCNYQTTSSNIAPVVTWKYKSYCQDPIKAALNPSSASNVIAQNNPNYNPNIECADSARTVKIVASKQGSSVTLSQDYQGRKITIVNGKTNTCVGITTGQSIVYSLLQYQAFIPFITDADLNFAQTAWGDSGVYVCSVISSSDLTGNSEDYTEFIVLERKANTTDLLPGIELLVMEDWLLVVLVVLGFFLILLLIGICWCQCCPHTCCCYVSCPCCPERCCCPRALYEAGKAVKKGIPSQYAQYGPSVYGQQMYMPQNSMPMLPMPNGVGQPPPHMHGYEYDGASSVGQGSQVPLLHDQNNGGDHTRSGYRIQVDPDGNATRAIYYMEKELANLDPSRPSNYNRLDGMSEVSSLHDNLDPRCRGGRSQPPPLATVYDRDEVMSTISSVSQQGNRRDDYPRRGGPGGYVEGRGRARSMENLDDIGRHYPRNDYPPPSRNDGYRGRRGSDDEWSSSARSGADDHRRRDYSPEGRRGGGGGGDGLQGRRSRSRDDLMHMDRERSRGDGPRDTYDDSFLREAMEKKKLGEQQRGRSRDRLDSESDRSDRNGRTSRGPPPLPMVPPAAYSGRRDDFLPPPPPAYVSEDESVSSSKKSNLRKNGAVSRESLVV